MKNFCPGYNHDNLQIQLCFAIDQHHARVFSDKSKKLFFHAAIDYPFLPSF
jgi:hypothetical protein